MHVDCATSVAADPEEVFAVLADLSTYPLWLGIVQRVTPDPDSADGRRAWLVDLAGRIGPLTRTKRVRMARTLADPAAAAVRFERSELDGRAHSPWVLSGTVAPVETGGSTVRVGIHYGGPAWLPGAERLLAHEARRAGGRIDAVVAATRQRHF